ncbi:MAG TPA: hypothetical protein VGC42_00390 [Kofleriaceae bacterium]
MRLPIVVAVLGLSIGAGCSRKNQDGLPPANEWQASPGGSAGSDGEVAHFTPPRGMTPQANNPHAGMDMGGAGGEGAGGEGDNPHAGMDTASPTNPHTAGGGVDVTKMGLAAPDPDRKLDPSHRLTGMIVVDAKAKAKVKPGTAVFVIVKRAGADGAPSGPPLAVDKLTWMTAGVPFELTDAQAMVAGTELTGDVVITARYDQDSDALSKEPGDVTGQLRVKIPADNVKLTLDTILP